MKYDPSSFWIADHALFTGFRVFRRSDRVALFCRSKEDVDLCSAAKECGFYDSLDNRDYAISPTGDARAIKENLFKEKGFVFIGCARHALRTA